MKARRDFLRVVGLVGAGVATGCAGVGSGAARRWRGRQIAVMESRAPRLGGRGWGAWQGGKLVAEWRVDDGGAALSVTKVLAVLAATKAASEGWLSADERVAETIDEWRGSGRKGRITVGMLMQQVSGLESGVIPLYRNRPADKGPVAVALRCVDEPGAVFRYGPSHWEVLGEVLRRKLKAEGKGSLVGFMQRAVMRPVGLNGEGWRSDRMDVPYLSTGAVLTVRGLGRLGETLARLLRGESRRGLDAKRFAEMARVSAANPMFGGGLWRNGNARRPGAVSIEVEKWIDRPMSQGFWRTACLSRRQPPEMVALVGAGGKRVYVWPEERRVFARFGTSTAWRDGAFLDEIGD